MKRTLLFAFIEAGGGQGKVSGDDRARSQVSLNMEDKKKTSIVPVRRNRDLVLRNFKSEFENKITDYEQT